VVTPAGQGSFPFDLIVASPNVALDSYYVLSDLEVGAVNRSEKAYHTAGGKGINLARAAKILGGRVLNLGIAGGHNGRFIAAELEREQIAADLVWMEQETRRSSTIISPAHQQTTVVLDAGMPVTEVDGQQLIEKILEHVLEAPYLVLTGSLPPGLPSRYYRSIIESAKSCSSVKIGLDCAGEALQSAAGEGVQLIKVNVSEYLGGFNTQPSFHINSALRTFESLQSGGLEVLIITDSAQGAYVISSHHPPFLVKTRVQTWVSTAGAGDTFMAGLILALNRGEGIESAAAYASAAAAATLQQVVCGGLDPKDVEAFLPLTHIQLLTAGETVR